MKTYLNGVKGKIQDNYRYFTTWETETDDLKSRFSSLGMETTFLNTNKNFVVIWINSINEILLEQIVYEYYKRYFDKIFSETNHKTYSDYELLKVEQIIKQNHDGSFDWFSGILEKVVWSINQKNIKGEIKKWYGRRMDTMGWKDKKFSDFTDVLWKINTLRNELAHNSSNYFLISKSITDYWKEVKFLEDSFIVLSELFFEKMNNYYNITP